MQEETLEKELQDLLAEQASVDCQQQEVTAAIAAADEKLSSIWQQMNTQQLEEESIADERLAKTEVLNHCKRELQRLKMTSVLDDVFDIWFDGSFGTISGLRLGRLPDTQVEWAEINAGLGHAAFLVDTLATMHSLRLPRHILHPMGSFSKIATADDPRNMYELYGSSSMSLGRIFSGTRFDTALGMFLQCIGALISHATAKSTGTIGPPPYIIEEDRIGIADNLLSIKMQYNQDELWTRALKYMLTNLKWLLAWHTQLSTQRNAAALGQQGSGLLPSNTA